MENVQKTVSNIEKDREQKFGKLGQYLKMTNQNTQELARTTTQLKEALANSKPEGNGANEWPKMCYERPDLLKVLTIPNNLLKLQSKHSRFYISLTQKSFIKYGR